MRRFASLLAPLLDRRIKRRLLLGAVAAVLVAAVEAVGLLLVVPLVQLLAESAASPRPKSVRWIAAWLPGRTPLGLASVLAAVVFAAFVVKGIASLAYLRWNMTVVLDAEATMSKRLLRAYLYSPYPFHLQRNSSVLQRAVHDDVRRVYEDALVAFVGGAADAVLIVAVGAVLLAVEPVTALVTGLYFLAVGIAYQRLVQGRVHVAAEEIQENVSTAYRIVQQSLGAIKEVQIRRSQEMFLNELDVVKRGTARRLRTLLMLHNAPRYYLELAMIVGLAAMAAVLFHVRSAPSATAALSLFLASGFRVLPSLNRVLVASSAVRAATPALGQIAADLAMLEAKPDAAQSAASPQTIERLGPASIRMEGVGFAYGPDLPAVLHDIDLEIQAGESVAFIGASGAGKSTLLDIVLGLLPPTTGSVLIDRRPLPDVLAAWHDAIGYVPQDVVLLDESLRRNVALGVASGDIDDDRVRSALTAADLDEVVAGLPNGLDTSMGERGQRLSGGQRQRVGIARALYANPSCLILDEATSSLDSGTEARMTATIEALREGLTVIIVTHRLGTVRTCDRIYVLDGGTIAEVGRYDDLVRNSRRFGELHRLSEVDDGEFTP